MKTLLFSESYYLYILISLICFLFVIQYKNKMILIILVYLIVIGFLMYFYRIPDRNCSNKNLEITSPADGTILGIYKKSDGKKGIAIYLSLSDVHVQYIPYNGIIVDQKYKPGEFYPAGLFNKSKYNEKSIIDIKTDHGIIKVQQIAGILANRIVTIPEVGDRVKKGEVYGMIKLSSRVDLILPENAEILVKKGDKVTGCKSVLAKFNVK